VLAAGHSQARAAGSPGQVSRTHPGHQGTEYAGRHCQARAEVFQAVAGTLAGQRGVAGNLSRTQGLEESGMHSVSGFHVSRGCRGTPQGRHPACWQHRAARRAGLLQQQRERRTAASLTMATFVRTGTIRRLTSSLPADRGDDSRTAGIVQTVFPRPRPARCIARGRVAGLCRRRQSLLPQRRFLQGRRIRLATG